MTDKPELYAKSPDDGKRHRWEVVEIRKPREGDVFLGILCAPLSGVLRYETASVDEFRPILRDLGPVEEEKTPEDIVAEKIKELATMREEQREEVIRAYVAKHGFNPEETEQVLERDSTGLIWKWTLRRKADAAEVARLKARVEESERQTLREQREAKEYFDRSETRIAELETAFKRAFEANTELHADIANLESQLKAANQHVTDLYRQRAELKSELDAISVFNPNLGQRAKVARRLIKQFDPAHPERDLAWWRGKAKQAKENCRFYKNSNDLYGKSIESFNTRYLALETELREEREAKRELEARVENVNHILDRTQEALGKARSSPHAPLPVGVVRRNLGKIRLPVVDSLRDGVLVHRDFSVEKCAVPNGETTYVLGEYMGVPSAVAYSVIWEMERNGQMFNDYKNPRHWILRRLDAPEKSGYRAIERRGMRDGQRFARCEADAKAGRFPLINNAFDWEGHGATVFIPAADAPEEGKAEKCCSNCDSAYSLGNYTVGVDVVAADDDSHESYNYIVVDMETGKTVGWGYGVGKQTVDAAIAHYRAIAKKRPETPAPQYRKTTLGEVDFDHRYATCEGHARDGLFPLRCWSKDKLRYSDTVVWVPVDPAPPKEEPRPVRLLICEDDGGGFGWFMPIPEGQPSFHTPWVILLDGIAAQRTSGAERKGLVKLVPVESPAEAHC